LQTRERQSRRARHPRHFARYLVLTLRYGLGSSPAWHQPRPATIGRKGRTCGRWLNRLGNTTELGNTRHELRVPGGLRRIAATWPVNDGPSGRSVTPDVDNVPELAFVAASSDTGISCRSQFRKIDSQPCPGHGSVAGPGRRILVPGFLAEDASRCAKMSGAPASPKSLAIATPRSRTIWDARAPCASRNEFSRPAF